MEPLIVVIKLYENIPNDAANLPDIPQRPKNSALLDLGVNRPTMALLED